MALMKLCVELKSTQQKENFSQNSEQEMLRKMLRQVAISIGTVTTAQAFRVVGWLVRSSPDLRPDWPDWGAGFDRFVHCSSVGPAVPGWLRMHRLQ